MAAADSRAAGPDAGPAYAGADPAVVVHALTVADRLDAVTVRQTLLDGQYHRGSIVSDDMMTMINRLISDLGPATSLVIVGGGLVGLYRAAVRWYGRTVGSRRDLTRRLNQFAAGVTLPYVEERFGTPAFTGAFVVPDGSSGSAPEESSKHPVRDLVRAIAEPGAPARRPSTAVGMPGTQAGSARPRPVRELVYREKHAWVQVLIDQNDAVIRFSITVTDPKFHFSTRDLTWGHLPVKLGRSRFSEVQVQGFALDGRSLRIGAHNHEYAEAYWFGNPGQYQHYVLSSNEIGTGGFGYSILSHGLSFCREGTLAIGPELPVGQQGFDPDAEYARRFRAETTINTLTILGPSGPTADLAEPRGPESNQVRVLVPGRRELRQMRRRIRRLNEHAPASVKRVRQLLLRAITAWLRRSSAFKD
jgi:hypothetical protein